MVRAKRCRQRRIKDRDADLCLDRRPSSVVRRRRFLSSFVDRSHSLPFSGHSCLFFLAKHAKVKVDTRLSAGRSVLEGYF